MLRRIALILLTALPATAQEAVVTLPVLPPLPEAEAHHLLSVLVMAETVAWNCDTMARGTAPRLLLAGTVDRVLQDLALDDAALEAVRAPMLAATEKTGFCDTQAPRIGAVLDMLVFWGGSLTLIRD